MIVFWILQNFTGIRISSFPSLYLYFLLSEFSTVIISLRKYSTALNYCPGKLIYGQACDEIRLDTPQETCVITKQPRYVKR